MAHSKDPQSVSDGNGRNLVLLVLTVVLLLLVLDFFYGSFTKPLVVGQATLRVVTDPPGAQVIADTQELGTTPLEGGKILPGEYVLRVEHPYFEPIREKINVKRGDTVERSHRLTPAFGTLRLVSNPRGASIRLNGVLQEARTPATLEQQPAGVHEVELFLEGRRPAQTQVEVRRGARSLFNAELNRLPVAKLTLDLKPRDAKVELLDTDLVYEPGMVLPVASYRLRVSHPGYLTDERVLEIKKRANRIQVTLDQLVGRLQVEVSPADALIQVRAKSSATATRYVGPVELPLGTITVEASKPGFRTQRKIVQIEKSGLQLAFDLEEFNLRPGRKFSDKLQNVTRNIAAASSQKRGPELVELAPGKFRMGDTLGIGVADELPVRSVAFSAPFAIGVREVTRSEWAQQFAGVSADALTPEERDQPITSVSFQDVQAYVRWLSEATGEVYRLPSEAEWEYAARAGQSGRYGATDTAANLCNYANVADSTLQNTYEQWAVVPCDDGHLRPASVGSFKPNAFGLFDTIGNVSEWVADCWHDNYGGAPSDGRAWGGARCDARVSRGGSWDTAASDLRLSFRTRVTKKDSGLGFRVVREL